MEIKIIMIINSAEAIYFSPTGTTKKIINSIIKGMGVTKVNTIDLTLPKVRNTAAPSIDSDIVLIGVPVYATEVPYILKAYLKSLKGNSKPVVLVAVYGNMSEGTTLNELYSITENSGFKTVAAGSFIAEHSFSSEAAPAAKGRPNCEDLNKAEEFGENIIKKIQEINNLDEVSLKIPQGKKPLMAKILPDESAKLFAKPSAVDTSVCNHCGACVKLCPMGAIDSETLDVNLNDCLRCFCCVKRCPKKARKIIYKPNFIVTKVLTIKGRAVKEIKTYL